MKKVVAAGLALTMISTLAVAGEEEEQQAHALSDVVVKASKMEQKIEEMTDSVTVISEQEIKEKGFTDLTEVLRYTPSVEFKQAGGPGQFSYPKIRGFGQGHFLMLVNGMKVNEGYSAGVGNFIGQLDTVLLENVEILRGPQASLYGSDTTAGVMAFSTISGYPEDDATVGVEYGSLEWKKAYATARGGTGDWDYAFGFAVTDSDGVHDEEYYTNMTPTMKVGWHPGEADIEFSYTYIESDFQAAELDESNDFLASRDDHYAFQTPDPNNTHEVEHHLATLSLENPINKSFRHKGVLGLFQKKATNVDGDDGLLGYQTSPWDGFTFDGIAYNAGDAVPIYDGGDGQAYGYDNTNIMWDENLIWDAPLGEMGDNTALLGFEYYYQEGSKWGKYGDVDASTNNYSFYLNDQVKLLDDDLLLTAGARLDEHETFGSEVTYKVGGAYTTFTETTLFTNYGTSFKAPCFSYLYDPSYGNEDLDPEKGWTVEGGVRQQLIEGKIYAEVTGWYTKLEDVIVFDYTIVNPRRDSGYGEYNNRDEGKSSGVEVVLSYIVNDRITLDANYTYTDSTSEEDGVEYRTVQIARNKGSLTCTYRDETKSFGVTGYYAGPRLRWKGDVEMEEYFRVDIFGRYALTAGLDLYGRVENLFDEDIEEGLGYEQPGIYAIVGLKYTFNTL